MFQRSMPSVALVATLILVLGCNTPAVQGDSCAKEDMKFGGTCYKFVKQPVSWTQAQKFCISKGGNLLHSIDGETKEFLNQHLDQDQAWWVGQDLSDGETSKMKPTGPPPWMRGSGVVPSASDNDSFCTYIILHPTFQLVTTSRCNLRLYFVCQKEYEVAIRKRRDSNSAQTSNSDTNAFESLTINQQFQRALNATMENMRKPNFNILESAQVAEKFLNLAEKEVETASFTHKLQYMNILLNSSAMLLSREVIPDSGLNKTIDFIIKGANSILISSRSVCPKPNFTSKEIEILSDLYMKIIDNIDEAKLNAIKPEDPPFITETSLFSSYISSVTLQDLDNKNLFISNKQASFLLPDVDILMEKIKTDKPIKIRMMSFNQNPFTSPSKENITGTVASLSMSTAGGQIALSNLTEYIEIILPRPEIQSPPSTFLSTPGNPIIITLNITNPNDTVVLTVEPSKTIVLQLHLARGFEPTSKKYHFTTDLSFKKPADYRWLLTPEMLNLGLGTWYLKVTPINYMDKENLTLRVMSFTSRCLFWNPGNQDWSDDGCKVGIRSQPGEMHCLCNHLTFFGSSYFVMPNTVDLSRTAEYFSTINENYVVVLLVSAFYALYLVTVAWAWWEDRKAIKKRNLTLLTDNNPCAQYRYLLAVYTGHRRGAGTSAKVVVTLSGSEGESDPHHLTDPEKPVFERGGVDMFLLTTPFSLGELQGIRLWHHNTGDSPAWYVNKVSVYDLEAQRKWPFLCNCWLAADIDGATLDRVFPPATESQLTMFRYLFMWWTTQSFVDGHLWMSVLTRPVRSRFTRAQRVSCCFSLLLCTMLCNIMYWNITSGPDSLTIDLGIYSFSWADVMVGVQSALMMFPVNLLIVQLFRLSKPRPPRGTEQSHFGWVVLPTANFYTGLGIRTEKLPSPSPVPPRGCELPWWFVYLGWLCVFLTSGLAAFFTMMYGLKMGRVQSTQWLVAMAVTLFQSIFILQPLKVLTMALFLSLILKKRDPDGEDNEPLKICVTDPGDTVWFCQDRSDPLYQPPTPRLTQSARDLREQKRSLYLLLRDILAHLLFLSLLMVIAYAARNPNQFYLYRAVHSSTSTNLEWVREIQDFYPWANTTLLPNLYGEYRGFISDGHSWLLGSPRLLQVRVRDRPCPVISKTRQQCHPSYTSTDEDTANYGPGWTNSTTGGQSGLGQAWQYHTAASLQKNPVWGRLALYQGGGYAVELGTEREQAYRVLSLLSKEGWLDQRSRALLVEFNVFNANVNLFCVVTLALETSGMGGVYSSLLLHSMSLYLSMGSISLLVMAAHILYLIFVIYYMVMQGLLMKEQRLAYFRSLLNLVDMSIILMSWTGMGLYISTLVLGDRLISQYQGDRTRFVSFEQVVLVDSIYNYLIAFLVCLATVKLWHLLRLNPKLYLISSAIRRAWGELRLFLLIIVILIISYSITCNLLFGWSLSSYSTVSRSAITILCLLMGSFNYNEVLAVDHILAVVVIGSCIIFVVFIAVNLFVSVLLVSFQKEIKNPTPCEDAFVMEILLRKLGSLLGFNPQGSKKNTEPAETEKNTKKKGARRPVAAFVQQWPRVKLDSGAPIFYSYQ